MKHLPGYDKNLFSYPRISKEIKEDPNPELMRAWDSIMKGGNDEKDDIERDAAKEKSPEKSYYDRYKELEDPIEDLLYKKPEELSDSLILWTTPEGKITDAEYSYEEPENEQFVQMPVPEKDLKAFVEAFKDFTLEFDSD